jgi:hypothetical protein
MAQAPNAILAINSTDRYITNLPGKVLQPIQNTLFQQYFGGPPFSNDFQISSPNALMNGYIDKIIISQIQLQYNLPTIIPGANNKLVIQIETSAGSGLYNPFSIIIPYGFYTPHDLAAQMQVTLEQLGDFEVNYVSINQFELINNSNKRFFFPTPIELAGAGGQSETDVIRILKTYRLFGFNVNNSNPNTFQYSSSPPQFLYTPYIDIYSDTLTNYQKLKDTDSSTSRRKGLISRLYLSGVGTPQTTFANYPETTINLTSGVPPSQITGTATSVSSGSLGSSPFVVTYDLNNPKVVNWTPDSAINSLDFQMRDCYGDLLYVDGYDAQGNYEGFSTEFQMTLLCVES